MRLASQLDTAIPQIALLAIARKLSIATVYAMLKIVSYSSVSQSNTIRSFKNCYRTMETRLAYMWVSAYIFLVFYVLWDFAFHVNGLINCEKHELPRPLGIYCATSLACFVFTSKLSTSMMSCVVMICAKEMNMLTGIACIVNFSAWAGVRGTSITLFAVSLLSGVHFLFCGHSSSALLCCCGFAWAFVWVWLTLLSSIFDNINRSNTFHLKDR